MSGLGFAAAAVHGHLQNPSSEGAQPKFRVGTRFLKDVPGWGLFEGIIALHDNGYYSVNYEDIDVDETLSEETMCSDDVTITTNWDTHLLREGDDVWAFMKKGKHPAKILRIRRSEEKALVKWTTSDKKGDVDLHILFPMFDNDESGRMVTSSMGKRKKAATNFYDIGKEDSLHRAKYSKVKKDPVSEDPNKKRGDSGKKQTNHHSTKVKHSKATKRKHKFPVKRSERKRSVKIMKEGDTKDHPKTDETKVPAEQTVRREQLSAKVCTRRPRHEDVYYLESKGWTKDNWWVSPQLKMPFRPVEAIRFHDFCEKHNGDEAAALDDYNIHRWDSNKSEGPAVKAEECEREDKIDNNPISFTEEEYNMLWDTYMKQQVRLDEEIPSGIKLRAKTAQCSLLRSKSDFRKLVHKKILALNRSGTKTEIYRILKKLFNHDVSGHDGDGPADLVKEFTGLDQGQSEFFDGEVKVEAVEPNNVAAARAVTVEDLSVGVSCDHTSLSSLSESLPLAAYSTHYDKAVVQDCSMEGVGINRVDMLASDDDTKVIELLSDIDNNEPPPSEIDDSKPASVHASGISYTGDVYDLPTPVKQTNEGAHLDIVDLVNDDDDESKPPAAVAVLKASPDMQKKTTASKEVIDLVDDDDDSNVAVGVVSSVKSSLSENGDHNGDHAAMACLSEERPTTKTATVETIDLTEESD